jgi:hypothetical protein
MRDSRAILSQKIGQRLLSEVPFLARRRERCAFLRCFCQGNYIFDSPVQFVGFQLEVDIVGTASALEWLFLTTSSRE